MALPSLVSLSTASTSAPFASRLKLSARPRTIGELYFGFLFVVAVILIFLVFEGLLSNVPSSADDDLVFLAVECYAGFVGRLPVLGLLFDVFQLHAIGLSFKSFLNSGGAVGERYLVADGRSRGARQRDRDQQGKAKQPVEVSSFIIAISFSPNQFDRKSTCRNLPDQR